MDNRISRTISYIKNNLDKNLSLELLSSYAYMSPNYFHRCFKTATNLAPYKFVELCKVKEGYRQLTNSSNSIHDISLNLGYSNYETFTRVFKKHYKISPDDLRSIVLKISTKINVDINGIIPIISTQNNKSNALIKLKNELSNKKMDSCKDLNARVYSVERSNNLPYLKLGKGRSNKYKVLYNKNLSKILSKQMKSIIVSLLIILNVFLSMNMSGQNNNELEGLLKSQGYNKIHLKKEISGHLMMQAIFNGIEGHFFFGHRGGLYYSRRKAIRKI